MTKLTPKNRYDECPSCLRPVMYHDEKFCPKCVEVWEKPELDERDLDFLIKATIRQAKRAIGYWPPRWALQKKVLATHPPIVRESKDE